MEKLMTAENLARFAYTNAAICRKPIRGIVLCFFGLNGREMYSEDTPDGKYFAEKGILYVILRILQRVLLKIKIIIVIFFFLLFILLFFFFL